MIKDENYIVINGWMINHSDMNLIDMELVLYVVLYRDSVRTETPSLLALFHIFVMLQGNQRTLLLQLLTVFWKSI